MTAAVDLLILGAGWTAEFLIPLLQQRKPAITFAATTRNGRIVAGYKTITFEANSNSDWTVLPQARTIVLTFPTTKEGAVTTYVEAYESVHGHGARWLQLGSTSAWDQAAESLKGQNQWITRHTEIPRPAVARVESEFELLSLSGSSGRQIAVLNLAGLWGGSRDARNWVLRVAGTKEALAAKGTLHVVHGIDVARAILAIHENFTAGERWLLTDARVYDWWDLASAWGSGGLEGKGNPVQGDQGARTDAGA